MRILLTYPRFAPFHVARIRAANRRVHEAGGTLLAVEIAGAQHDYGWSTDFGAAEIRTLFPEQDYFAIPARVLRRAIGAVLRDLRPDVVVINGWGMRESWPLLTHAARLRAARVVISDSQEIDLARPLYKEIVKRAFVQRCQSALVGGKPHIRYLEKLGMLSECCFPGCDVVDNELFAAARRTQRGSDADELRLLSCLRLIPAKNVVPTLAAIRRSTIPWRWSLAGDGPERSRIVAALRELRLEHRVELLGRVSYEQLPQLHAQHDVYFQPSVSEPWCLAINEAMASGMPVLASTQCGCREDLLTEGVTGFTFDARDGEAMRRALETIWLARGRWQEMSGACRQAVAPWSLELFAESLLRASNLALKRVRAGALGGSVLEAALRIC